MRPSLLVGFGEYNQMGRVKPSIIKLQQKNHKQLVEGRQLLLSLRSSI